MARSKNALEVQDLGDSSIDQQAMSGAMLAMREQGTQVATLAEQIGYDGSLTVGALEDGIRFYQRRSVEALLEVGIRARLVHIPRGGKPSDARSECYPLVVNNLVCRAMNAATRTGWPIVDAQVIAAC